MDLLKRIRGLNVFGKKLFVFGVLFALSLPLLFVIANNFQKRMAKFEKKQFPESFNLPKISKESEEAPGQTTKEVEEILKMLEGITKEATTSTSTL